MNLKNYFKIVLLLVCVNVHSQISSSLVFNKELNNLIARKGEELTVFKVVTKTTSKTITSPSVEKISDKYKAANTLVSKTKTVYLGMKEVIDAVASKNELINKKNLDLERIKTNINKFIISKEQFETKKRLLIEAQKISDKYNLGYLIYADSNINTKYKSKFFILSRNKLDLKIHFKKLILKIKNSTTPVKEERIDVEQKQRFKAAKERYKSAKEQLKKINKYIKIEGESNTVRYTTVELGSKVFKPENVLSGRFNKELKEYYIVRRDNVINMLSVEDAIKNNIKNKDFVYPNKFSLLKSNESDVTYLVYNDFLKLHLMHTEGLSATSKK